MTGEHRHIDEDALLEHLRDVDALLHGLAPQEPPPELVARTLRSVERSVVPISSWIVSPMAPMTNSSSTSRWMSLRWQTELPLPT